MKFPAGPKLKFGHFRTDIAFGWWGRSVSDTRHNVEDSLLLTVLSARIALTLHMMMTASMMNPKLLHQIKLSKYN